jgi:hypothetical protein
MCYHKQESRIPPIFIRESLGQRPYQSPTISSERPEGGDYRKGGYGRPWAGARQREQGYQGTRRRPSGNQEWVGVIKKRRQEVSADEEGGGSDGDYEIEAGTVS